MINEHKVGDVIRVTVDLHVDYRGFGVPGDSVLLGEYEGRDIYLGTEPSVHRRIVSVEVLPPPEPEWQARDLVVDANGNHYQRSALNRGWWAFGYGQHFAHDHPTRPLVHLIRDGKVVG